MNDPESQTREPQYQRTLDLKKMGLGTLGLMTNQAWEDDPKHLLFTLARYKFVAKMLSGAKQVLEVGCADAFATRIVVQEVAGLTAVDLLALPLPEEFPLLEIDATLPDALESVPPQAAAPRASRATRLVRRMTETWWFMGTSGYTDDPIERVR